MKIWSIPVKKRGEKVGFINMPDDEDEEDDREYSSNSAKWYDHFRESRSFFDQLIKILNRYGMLFPEPARGFSNVDMKSWSEENEQNI